MQRTYRSGMMKAMKDMRCRWEAGCLKKICASAVAVAVNLKVSVKCDTFTGHGLSYERWR